MGNATSKLTAKTVGDVAFSKSTANVTTGYGGGHGSVTASLTTVEFWKWDTLDPMNDPAPPAEARAACILAGSVLADANPQNATNAAAQVDYKGRGVNIHSVPATVGPNPQTIATSKDTTWADVAGSITPFAVRVDIAVMSYASASSSNLSAGAKGESGENSIYVGTITVRPKP